MHFAKRFPFWFIAVCFLVGCQAKLDGSSPQALMDSVKKMVDSAPAEERGALVEDIKTVAPLIQGVATLAAMKISQSNDSGSKSVLSTLNGLSAKDLQEKARAIRTEDAARQKISRIAEAEERVAEVKKRNEELLQSTKIWSGFKIISFEPNPVIENRSVWADIQVSNETGVQIDEVTFVVEIEYQGSVSPHKLERSQGTESIPNGTTKRVLMRIGDERSAQHEQEFPRKIRSVVPYHLSGLDFHASGSGAELLQSNTERLNHQVQILENLKAE